MTKKSEDSVCSVQEKKPRITERERQGLMLDRAYDVNKEYEESRTIFDFSTERFRVFTNACDQYRVLIKEANGLDVRQKENLLRKAGQLEDNLVKIDSDQNQRDLWREDVEERRRQVYKDALGGENKRSLSEDFRDKWNNNWAMTMSLNNEVHRGFFAEVGRQSNIAKNNWEGKNFNDVKKSYRSRRSSGIDFAVKQAKKILKNIEEDIRNEIRSEDGLKTEEDCLDYMAVLDEILVALESSISDYRERMIRYNSEYKKAFEQETYSGQLAERLAVGVKITFAKNLQKGIMDFIYGGRGLMNIRHIVSYKYHELRQRKMNGNGRG